MLRIVIIVFITFNFIITGCAVNPPPLEFAPNATIIEGAIALQLEKSYQHLSKHLESQKPSLKIEKINVRNIQATNKFNLPTYHLTGDYILIVKNAGGKKQKIKNTFSLDLQRQNAGKTWRLLLPDKNSKSGKYVTYLVRTPSR